MATRRTCASLLLKPIPLRTAIFRTSKFQSQQVRSVCIARRKRPSFLKAWHLPREQRFLSQTAPRGISKQYDFNSVKNVVENPSEDLIIIDVREPTELQDSGRIPGSLNIPITSAPDALFMNAEDFEDKFGFEQPAKEKEVLFYCKAGVRSKAAAKLAEQGGWTKVGEYGGSFLDWEGQGGKIERN